MYTVRSLCNQYFRRNRNINLIVQKMVEYAMGFCSINQAVLIPLRPGLYHEVYFSAIKSKIFLKYMRTNMNMKK